MRTMNPTKFSQQNCFEMGSSIKYFYFILNYSELTPLFVVKINYFCREKKILHGDFHNSQLT